MMKAKEMFENLGYSLEVNNENLIKYSKEVCGYTFFRFRLKDKEFCSGYQSIAHTTTWNELKAVIQQFKELGWLEEEKNEIKQETNYDHYKDEILKYYGQNLAVVKGRPTLCCETNCNDCDFKTNQIGCRETAKYWLKQQYKKPVYKLTKFEFDLIQTYRDCNTDCKLSERRILRELKDKGYFKNVDKDVLIKDILSNCEVIK